MSLDDLAVLHGTDKGSCCDRLAPKGYTAAYERLLGHRRDERLRLLEIGVHLGASMRMWCDYLPRAAVFGVDIVRREVDVASAAVLIGDQADRAFMATVADRFGPFDVVIDDGGHRTGQHVASFEALWPAVTGWYAIEDLRAAPSSVRWLGSLGERVEFPVEGLAIVHKGAPNGS